jgi:hypothetical protein
MRWRSDGSGVEDGKRWPFKRSGGTSKEMAWYVYD